jgi:4-amino-4-deoxy-L-arabinose transferase-like glycosyltransferase
VAAAVRFFHLGSQSLWIDEILTWYSANIGAPLGAKDLLENVHGPLFSLIEHAWCGWAGDSEWALRLPAALFGIATVPAAAWLGTRWLGRREGLWAAWLFALAPFHVWYSQEARNYSLLMLSACVSGALLLEARERGGRGRWAAYLAAAAAGLLSNLSFAFVLPLHASWAWRGRAPRTGRALRAGLAAVLLLAVVVPWAPQVARIWDWHRLHPGRATESGETPLRGATTFHAAAVPFALHAFAVGYTLGPSLRELRSPAIAQTLVRHAPGIAVVAVVFGALGVWGAIALRRRRKLGEALLWVAPALLVVSWFALANFKVFHPRYLAVAFPAFAFTLAAGFAALGPRARAAFGIAVLALWARSLQHLAFDPHYAKEDVRGAAARVRAEARPGEQVLAVNTVDALVYYDRGSLPTVPFWLGFAADSAKLSHKLDAALATAPGTWVVLSRPEDLDPRGRFVREMARRHPDAPSLVFEGVRVWHVRRAPDAAP